MTTEYSTLAGVLGAAAISGGFMYLAGHRQGRASFISAVQDAANQVITQLRTECDRVTGRCDSLTVKIDECEARHDACEDEVGDLKRRVAALMDGPIPPYTPGRKAA